MAYMIEVEATHGFELLRGTYRTRAAAVAALQELLADMADAVAHGYMSDAPAPHAYRITRR